MLKDYYAVMYLKEAVKANSDLVFKGGTCLSKCYKVIERFSEDVDLGMSCEHATEGMRKRMKYAVVEAANQLGLTISNLDKTRSRREFNRFEILLPNVSGQDPDILLVETAVMTPAAPAQPMPIQSYIGEYCFQNGYNDILDSYGLAPFMVMANSMQRTFCDKVFVVCDYYLSGEIPTRQSRHIYDIYKLLEVVQLDSALLELLGLVRAQRIGKHGCLSAVPSAKIAHVLQELISTDSYRGDYIGRTQPLLFKDVPYEEAAGAIVEIANFLEGEL